MPGHQQVAMTDERKSDIIVGRQNMRKFLLTTTLIAGLGAPVTSAHAQDMTPYADMPAGVYNIDQTHAQIIWQVSHLGLSDYTARFSEFDAQLTFDPKNPENSKLEATIDPTSIKTHHPKSEDTDFDKELAQGEGWFNAGAYPDIKYVSNSITKTGEHTGTMSGDLTFLGVTKPLTLDVEFNGAMEEQTFSKKPTLGFSAKGSLNRSEWGMDKYVPNIGDEVKIMIEAEFAKAANEVSQENEDAQ